MGILSIFPKISLNRFLTVFVVGDVGLRSCKLDAPNPIIMAAENDRAV